MLSCTLCLHFILFYHESMKIRVQHRTLLPKARNADKLRPDIEVVEKLDCSKISKCVVALFVLWTDYCLILTEVQAVVVMQIQCSPIYSQISPICVRQRWRGVAGYRRALVQKLVDTLIEWIDIWDLATNSIYYESFDCIRFCDCPWIVT